MEALGLLKFWRNSSFGADANSDGDDVRSAAYEEETDDDDSYFDLDFDSPDRRERDGDLKMDSQFIESPRGVLLSKHDQSSSPATILRSVPKFKVFMLGFRKTSKSEKAESSGSLKADPLSHLSKSSKLDWSNRFSFKCGAAADAPASPVFTRDNSLRSKRLKENFDYETASDFAPTEKSMTKYLKLIKPLYTKVSNKSKSTSVTPSLSPVNLSPRKFSEGSRMGSFKMATRNFGKSRPASESVEVAQPAVRRRDDDLLEQSNGIQGAILHCKKSFNSSSQVSGHSQLLRATNDPSHEKRIAPFRNSFQEKKRHSI